VAIAMHCNLRPPNVAPVVLGFNYEAHNAHAYKFNNFATLVDPWCMHAPNFNAIEQSVAE